MSYDELHHKIGQIESRLQLLEGEMKHMSQVKDDVKFIKDRSLIRDDQMTVFQSQMTSMQNSNIRIEMLLKGDYGSTGLVKRLSDVEDKSDASDKKIIWATASFVTIAVAFEFVMKFLSK